MEETQRAIRAETMALEGLLQATSAMAEASGLGCEECRLLALASISDALDDVRLWASGECKDGEDA